MIHRMDTPTPWHRGTLVAFDLETTGVDVATDRIVTATVAIIDGATGDVECREWLADPGIEIPEQATDVHGITTAHAREHGHEPAVVLEELHRALTDGWARGPVVAYHASYDLSLLTTELARHELDDLAVGAVIDPLVIDRAVDPYRPGRRTLTAAAAHYGVPLTEDQAHGATADALTAARIAWKLAVDYPDEIGAAEPEQLHGWQGTWHARWAEQFEAWLARQPDREPETIPREWPVRQAVAVRD